jgi:hypothetical protein
MITVHHLNNSRLQRVLWLPDRIHARGAYRHALERGGPYSY